MVATTQHAHKAPPLPGRNEPCVCGSGKKYKLCCARKSAEPVLSPNSVFTLIQEARRNLLANRLTEASHLLQLALRFEANNPDALHFLGLVAHQQGDFATALSFLERSTLAAPGNAGFFTNLALVLKAANDPHRALPFLRHAISLDPDHFDAHFHLGTLLVESGAHQQAVTSLVHAIRLQPRSADAVNTLGVCLMRMGTYDRAAVCFRQAIALNPRLAAPHGNLGRAFLSLSRLDEAIASLESALNLDSAFVDAMVTLGAVLNRVGRHAEAEAMAQRALELSPKNLESLLNLGNAYKGAGELLKAVAAYEQTIGSHPGDPRAHSNLGDTLRDLGRIAEAADAYRAALRVCSSFTVAHSNLLYLHAFARDVSPEEELALARTWERSCLSTDERTTARSVSSPRGGVFAGTPIAGRKLRIGIVSAELGTHAVAEFLQPFLETLDHGRFHLTLFPTVEWAGSRAEHLRSLGHQVISLRGASDAAAVDLIRHQKIDVLLDTSGHTDNNRLGIFARRAAPVQCTYIGYWSTTGLTEMDWFISDPHAPATVQSGFSEGLWRLPRIAVSYRGDHTLPTDTWAPAPSGIVRLGSFNRFGKIREETLALWAKVLQAIPQACLVLEDRSPNEEHAHDRIRHGLAAHGVETNRVQFVPFIPQHDRHMQLYNEIDIALDTLPFNSGTTAFDALWMGVPLVALEGHTIGGRMGASVLTSLGRPEWIARTDDQYVSIVASLAANLELRQQVRATQRARMAVSDLCDARGLARSLQEAFTCMYERWLAS